MASPGARAYTGSKGGAPGQGVRRGETSLKLKAFELLGVQKKMQIFLILGIVQTQKINR